MVKIRLQRVGAKKKPAYRVVVADSRSPRDGSFIEVIGHYDPRTEPPTIVIKQEKALEWLGRGAQPTPTVASLLSKAGVSNKQVSAFLRKATDRKTLKKAEKKAKKEAKAAPAAEAKPAKAPEAKPVKAPETEPAKAPETEPAKAPGTKPAKAPGAKPAKAPGAKPAEAPETKPAKAPEAKPAKAPDIKPAAASENE
jgi:small subunit ribosomal protein S16